MAVSSVLVMAMLAGASAAWAQVSDPSGGPAPGQAANPVPGQAANPAPGQAANPVPGPSRAATPGGTPVAPGAAAWDLEPDPAALPGQAGSVMRRPEPLLQKPSGFWTSGRPAVGGAYRYRLLAIGTGVLLVTAAVMVWIVRRYPRRDVEAPWNG
jgi:hypothetical protein